MLRDRTEQPSARQVAADRAASRLRDDSARADRGVFHLPRARPPARPTHLGQGAGARRARPHLYVPLHCRTAAQAGSLRRLQEQARLPSLGLECARLLCCAHLLVLGHPRLRQHRHGRAARAARASRAAPAAAGQPDRRDEDGGAGDVQRAAGSGQRGRRFAALHAYLLDPWRAALRRPLRPVHSRRRPRRHVARRMRGGGAHLVQPGDG
mmetsp:Transcript_21258/g.50702  ORF Transcript_21258/g.50702 Transcript_21258/m.50702 type:complete len:210 (+) Transcript_21258:308-937(+)